MTTHPLVNMSGRSLEMPFVELKKNKNLSELLDYTPPTLEGKGHSKLKTVSRQLFSRSRSPGNQTQTCPCGCFTGTLTWSLVPLLKLRPHAKIVFKEHSEVFLAAFLNFQDLDDTLNPL